MGKRKSKSEHGSIVDVLRRAIRNSDATIYRIAKNSGVAQVVISRFVSGERDVKLATAEKLCRVLRLSLIQEK